MKTDKNHWRMNQKADSKIQLKMNDSNYFVLNLKRDK